MTKKGVIVILAAVLVLGVLSFAGYRIINNISKNKAIDIDTIDIGYYYSCQNRAFFGWAGTREYMPYNKDYEWRLQMYMNLYIRKTGKAITLSDVETFLATSENSNGTPRTWKNDETNIVKDFVDWYGLWENGDELRFYELNMREILTIYCMQNPSCPYRLLEYLPPEYLIELDKKFLNPDYVLVLPVQ
jgi:hypothetical protein